MTEPGAQPWSAPTSEQGAAAPLPTSQPPLPTPGPGALPQGPAPSYQPAGYGPSYPTGPVPAVEQTARLDAVTGGPAPDFAGVERPAHAWIPIDVTAKLPIVEVGPMLGGAHAFTGAVSTARRGWAAAAHWLGIVTAWIGPLVVLLTVGATSRRVRDAAVASLNWEITVAVLLAVSVFLSRWGMLGPAFAVAVVILSIGLHVIGAVTAASGRSFTYPLALPIVR